VLNVSGLGLKIKTTSIAKEVVVDVYFNKIFFFFKIIFPTIFSLENYVISTLKRQWQK